MEEKKKMPKGGSLGLGLVTMLIALCVVVIVGLVVTGNLYTVANNMDLGSSGNNTRTSLFNNIYSSFDLVVIIPIIAAAAAIIGVVAWIKG